MLEGRTEKFVYHEISYTNHIFKCKACKKLFRAKVNTTREDNQKPTQSATGDASNTRPQDKSAAQKPSSQSTNKKRTREDGTNRMTGKSTKTINPELIAAFLET
jgi:hypothetical protein